MGTTADKLNKILETKQAIRQAIITKGVDVGEDTKFADYPSKIAAIQTGSSEGGSGSDAFFNLRTQNGTNMSYLFYSYPEIELDLSILDTSKAHDMTMMFYYCFNVLSLDLSNFNTSNVQNMYNMFNSCSQLQSLDLSGWDTRNVQNMGYMFAYCYALQSLDLSHWKTDNVNEIASMFDSCNSLQSLDVSGWNTSNVINMYGVFNCCFSLQSLDVSNWNTSNVNNMSCMFTSCNALQSLNVSNWITSNVTDMSNMFAYCNNLKSLDLSNWNTNNVTNMYSMFSWCGKLEEINISHFDMTNVGSCDDIFGYCNRLHTLRLDNCNYDTISKIINSSNFPTGEATDASGYPLNVPRQIYVQEANAAGLTAPDGWEFVYVESSEGGGMPGTPEDPVLPPIGPEGPEEILPEPSEPTETYVISFSTYGSTQLTVNNVDVSDQVVRTGGNADDTISYKYETTDVIRQASFKDNTDLVRVFGLDTSMMFHTEEMFSGCTNLVAILPMLDSSMAYSTRAMFKNCTSLTSMNTIGSFVAASNKSEMFYNCTSLTGTANADQYWNNPMVGSYAGCFHNCTSLDNYSEIPASWGGPRNENSDVIEPDIPLYVLNEFKDNTDITEVNVLVTNEHTDLSNMFFGCFSLTTIHNIDKWDTSNVTKMNSMFGNCMKLTELNLSSFNTSKVTNMMGMFQNCDSIEFLDLSNFDIEVKYSYMIPSLGSCSKLHTLRLDNCSNDTINKIITSAYLPTGTINGVTRKIYCKEENAADLTAPDGWEFIYIG